MQTTATPEPLPTAPPARGAAKILHESQARLRDKGAQHIGDLASWNAHGIDIDRQRGLDVFAAAGFKELWPGIEPGTALYRGVQAVRPPKPKKGQPGKYIDVRKFVVPNADTTVAYCVYIVEPRPGESGDKYTPGARVRVDSRTMLVVAHAPEGEPAIDEALAVANQIADHANRLLTYAETRDVSQAMVAVIKALSGVPLRDNGGAYLLPTSTCMRWRELLPGLRELGVEPICIDMYDTANSVAAVASAAKSALESDIADLLTDLQRVTEQGMQKGALERRVTECDALAAKAELYRGVLAGITDKILGRVASMRESFSARIGGGGAEVDAGLFEGVRIIDE